MVYKKLIKIILFLFFSLNAFSNILYDKDGIIITDIELIIYKNSYIKYHNSKISDANSLKDLVLMKNVIRDLKENNAGFMTIIDNEIINQFERDTRK